MRSFSELALATSIAFCLGACGSTTTRLPDARGDLAQTPAAPTTLFPAPLRLASSAIPRSYDLTLRVDPAQPTISGEVRIALELTTPTRLVRLHADGLEITSARAIVGGRTVSLTAHRDHGQLALVADEPLSKSVTIMLTWTGPLPEAPVGIYRARDDGHSYVFTQFEPLEARRAFPCFDEPGFKTPFTLNVEVPASYTPFSNDPEVNKTPLADGWVRHAFAQTKPLPTYLVALVIGEFDVVDGDNLSGGTVPFRIITPKGKGHLARFALERAPRYVDMLEAWFGIPYPFAKLDFVAVPSFSSSGMENAGLITFREAAILTDADAAIEDRTRCESLIAHELAHMWVGDLVTMQWWDDLWLNEAFATWMGRKAMMVVSPELDIAEQALRSKFSVMNSDARANARAVRQPIVNDGDIYNAFDGITYSKGAAILTMLEGWIGPDHFQAGVRSYLREHAWGNATTSDLMTHLARASSIDVTPLVASFLDQPGVPLVTLDWRCEADGIVSLELQQSQYRAMGDPRGALNGLWQIPICARLSNGKKTFDHCAVLENAKATWQIHPGFCPTFAHPNVAESGYYRWDTRLGPISIARGDQAAFAGYIASLRAGVERGTLPLAQLIDGVAPLFEASVSPSELDDLVGALSQIVRFDIEARDDPRFQKKARALLDQFPLDLSLGKTPRERRRMPTLVRALAGLSHDKRVYAYANKIADSFLRELDGKTAKPTPMDKVNIYLPLYVNNFGRDAREAKQRAAAWKRLRAAFDKVRDPNERELIIEALAGFDDPDLVIKTYELLLDGTLRAQDMRTVRARTSGRKLVADTVWAWFTEHFDALVDKLGSKSAPSLPGMASAYCSEADAAKVEAFFATKRGSLPDGIDRPLAQTLEGIRACAAGRERYAAEARAWYVSK